jgi:hypothetical protein
LKALSCQIRYNRRIVEAVISVIKRKFGEAIRARKFYNQVKEVKLKILLYNINKKVVEIICIKLSISIEPNIRIHHTLLMFCATFPGSGF